MTCSFLRYVQVHVAIGDLYREMFSDMPLFCHATTVRPTNGSARCPHLGLKLIFYKPYVHISALGEPWQGLLENQAIRPHQSGRHP
ncbi:hypothetical protein ALP12_200361 [Pseudomonas savastanoi pv. phaseolicola]|nr:hypothetical protein ALP12_200361 [Pseudomonas savastanoi pv. phaseolicola]